MNVFLKIDNKANVALTNRLEKLHKSDLPAAVRNTLNKAAFDMKQRTILASAERHFEKRKENFFKANSRVEMARGNKVSQMKSLVGFIHLNAKYNNYAVLELEQQEFGGTIPKRSFIPTDNARQGESYTRMVKKSERMEAIKDETIIDASKQRGSTRKQKYISAAIKAGRRGLVKAGMKKAMIYRINSLRREGRKMIVKSTPIYSYERGRDVAVKSTRFVREALLITGRKLDTFFMQEAHRRFDFRIK